MDGIFLDTGNIDEIKQYHSMGIIRGVTTNPSILVKEKIGSGNEVLKKRVLEIAEMIAPLPLSVEVTSNDYGLMEKQALEFAGWAKNINVKITIHGPEGELENLKLIHELETKRKIPVNVTAMMSAQQCFAAAMAGASYVSIFAGRVNDMGYDSKREISNLRDLIDRFRLKAKIIAGSTREAANIAEWLHAGAHIVTATPALIKTMLVHPYSKETVRQFLRDGAAFNAK